MLQKKTVYPRNLPSGWYPETEEEILSSIASWLPAREKKAKLCVVPHAGWFFSGALAWQGITALSPAKTLIVLGGHLSPHSPILASFCDAFETPLGPLETDTALLEEISSEIHLQPDTPGDNTTEIQLPLIKHAFPQAKALCLRVPPGSLALALGGLLARLAHEGRSLAVVASTDLTHYGPGYGFAPKGTGPSAEKWVKEENDAPFLAALAAGDYNEALRLGLAHKAACSAGAAAAAALCAGELQLRGRIAAYATSLDKHTASSFVGYGVVVYE
ncbi:MAG: AmmeMemoRadiSam system protein B [Spirochaetales bacterium]|jgi:AmmeMemoRadiSam system protein B|nr:AmmeMemoRadiSam system protein B [Spirochaetales bacterium]